MHLLAGLRLPDPLEAPEEVERSNGQQRRGAGNGAVSLEKAFKECVFRGDLGYIALFGRLYEAGRLPKCSVREG